MANKTLINGKTTDTLSSLDRGLHYGDGVFETIAIYEKQPLCLTEHLTRLDTGCKRILIAPVKHDVLIDEITSLSNAIEQGVIKIIITRGQGSRGYVIPEKVTPTRIVSLHPWPEYPIDNIKTGINAHLCTNRYSQNSALGGIKHLNRLEQIMARSEIRDRYIAEGIVMDTDDNIIEGTMSNIFFAVDNELLTPDLSECGVEGIIRQKIINLSAKNNINLKVQKVSLQLLSSADEVFVCNSLIGIWPVKMIDDYSYKQDKFSKKIRQLLEEENSIPKTC